MFAAYAQRPEWILNTKIKKQTKQLMPVDFLFSTCTYTHLLTPMNTYVSIYYTQKERETEQDIQYRYLNLYDMMTSLGCQLDCM